MEHGKAHNFAGQTFYCSFDKCQDTRTTALEIAFKRHLEKMTINLYEPFKFGRPKKVEFRTQRALGAD